MPVEECNDNLSKFKKTVSEFFWLTEACQRHGLGDKTIRTNMLSLLTTQVENFHAVSRMRRPTFSLLEYARDFGLITKESLKRTTKWAAKYFTHPSSYYPVPESMLSLANTPSMSSLPCLVVQHDEIMRLITLSVRAL